MTECLDKIANIMINYYKPFRMIEYKYKEKVTAIGLLKKAQMGFPNYLLPYYEKLMDYKLAIILPWKCLKIFCRMSFAMG